MNKREKELLLQLERIELGNLKIILSLKQTSGTLNQTELDYLLEKISISMKKIKDLEKLLDY